MNGHRFEKSEESPFKDFVTTLSESMIKAKKDGNIAIDYIYNMLMNSFYRRFGIKLENTSTKLWNNDRLRVFIQTRDTFLFSQPLTKNWNIASYIISKNSIFEIWPYMKNDRVKIFSPWHTLSCMLWSYFNIYNDVFMNTCHMSII